MKKLKIGGEIMGNKKRNCRLRSENRTGCYGDCYLNIAGCLNVWGVMSKYCKGTEEGRDMIDNIFHGKKDKKELLNKYNFTEEEKEVIVGQLWF